MVYGAWRFAFSPMGLNSSQMLPGFFSSMKGSEVKIIANTSTTRYENGLLWIDVDTMSVLQEATTCCEINEVSIRLTFTQF